MEARDGKRRRIGNVKIKRNKGDSFTETQVSAWTPLPNLAPDLTKGLGLKVSTAL